jgi:hypothetical protein
MRPASRMAVPSRKRVPSAIQLAGPLTLAPARFLLVPGKAG